MIGRDKQHLIGIQADSDVAQWKNTWNKRLDQNGESQLVRRALQQQLTQLLKLLKFPRAATGALDSSAEAINDGGNEEHDCHETKIAAPAHQVVQTGWQNCYQPST